MIESVAKKPAAKAPTYQTGNGQRISRADAAARMYGAGSPQHRKAQEMDRKGKKRG